MRVLRENVHSKRGRQSEAKRNGIRAPKIRVRVVTKSRRWSERLGVYIHFAFARRRDRKTIGCNLTVGTSVGYYTVPLGIVRTTVMVNFLRVSHRHRRLRRIHLSAESTAFFEGLTVIRTDIRRVVLWMYDIRMLFDALSHAGQKAKSCSVRAHGAPTVGGEPTGGATRNFATGPSILVITKTVKVGNLVYFP